VNSLPQESEKKLSFSKYVKISYTKKKEIIDFSPQTIICLLF